MGKSVLIQRDVKLIFKDVLPGYTTDIQTESRFVLLDSHPQAHPTGSEDCDPEKTVILVLIVIDHG